MTVRVEVYLPFRGRSVWRGEEQVSGGSTVGELVGALGLIEPETTILLNGRWAAPDTVLQAGDLVTVLRQAEGG